MIRVDIVVPIRNEEQTLPMFLDRLASLRLPKTLAVKVIFVEDSSVDSTRPLLRRLAAERPDVGYYCLARGFGQALAASYGISQSTADAIIMMDADGSHPPEVIPDMVRGFLDGAQVVQCARRTLSNRKVYRELGAAAFHLLARVLTVTDTTEQNIFYRLVSADVARDLLRNPRYLTYLRFPLPRADGALRTIYVDSVERVAGQSNYNLRRLIQLAVEGILSQMSPTRLGALVSGMCLAALSLLVAGHGWAATLLATGSVWVIVRYWRLGQPVLDRMEVLECRNVPAARGSSNLPPTSSPQAEQPPQQS